jgi:hypothetical protein
VVLLLRRADHQGSGISLFRLVSFRVFNQHPDLHPLNMIIRRLLCAILPLVCLVSCGTSTPIQRYSESKSHFRSPPVLMSHSYPERDIYRVYCRGASGFVPISAVRSDLEERAEKFCQRQGKMMVPLGEQMSHQPYILGNFPRMEIVFAAVNKP